MQDKQNDLVWTRDELILWTKFVSFPSSSRLDCHSSVNVDQTVVERERVQYLQLVVGW